MTIIIKILTYLIPLTLLSGPTFMPAPCRSAGGARAVCARARPAQTQRRARRPCVRQSGQTVTLHVVLTRVV